MKSVLYYIDRANQRGGRMLSVIDLIERETLSVRQAAWLLKKIEEGSSWIVGARPGGAGKTALMAALLAMLPEGEKIILTEPESGWEKSPPGTCLLSYEIGSGNYDAYIWGAELRKFAELGANACRLVTNLHADTLEQARSQIVDENGVPGEYFPAFGIFISVTVRSGSSGVRRTVRKIHFFSDGKWMELLELEAMSAREKEIAGFLEDLLQCGIRTVEQVRQKWCEISIQFSNFIF
jgi:hypothetical protein